MMFTRNEPKFDRIVPAQGGIAVRVNEGDLIKVIDIKGEQVADFTAVRTVQTNEYLSAGVTIDVNNSLRLDLGSVLYSNRYAPMFTLVGDTVGAHDLIHPMCSPDMYTFQYGITGHHPSCCHNIREAYKFLGIEIDHMPVPLNIFMNTVISQNGDFVVEKPKSKSGDYILLEAMMDVVLGIAACSVQESKCNGFNCSPIQVQILN